jgi:hypothetical protein
MAIQKDADREDGDLKSCIDGSCALAEIREGLHGKGGGVILGLDAAEHPEAGS